MFRIFWILLLSTSLFADWMDDRIERDFKRYAKKGISRELIDETWKNCEKTKEFRRYKIIDSKVYGREGNIKNLLEALVKAHPVPDVDFIYFYEDRVKPSFFKRSAHRNSGPIFASAKRKDLDFVVLFSDWNYNIQEEKSGWNFLIKKIEETPIAWKDRIEKLFWRGTPWDGKHFGMYDFQNWKQIPRGTLVAASMENPQLIDAAFSEYPLKCSRIDLNRCIQEMGPIRFASWEEMFRQKYQAVVDGVTCTYPAYQWKLLSGSLVFKQDSEDIQYFYDALTPWEHYIPVKNDLSDLKEKILWAKKNDVLAKHIAQNGRKFAQNHLMPEHILLYCYKVLLKYASLQKFQPTAP